MSISIASTFTSPLTPFGTMSTAMPTNPPATPTYVPVATSLAEHAAEKDDEERDDGDDQGCEAARDVALAKDDEAVAAEQQCQTHETRAEPLLSAEAQRARSAGDEQQGEQDQAGRRVSKTGREEGRHRLVDDADRQVRRTPDDVDDQKSRPHLPFGRVPTRPARLHLNPLVQSGCG